MTFKKFDVSAIDIAQKKKTLEIKYYKSNVNSFLFQMIPDLMSMKICKVVGFQL